MGRRQLRGQHVPAPDKVVALGAWSITVTDMYSNRGMDMADMDREGGQGGLSKSARLAGRM